MATYTSVMNVPRMDMAEDIGSKTPRYGILDGILWWTSGHMSDNKAWQKKSVTFYLGYLFMNHRKTLFSLRLGGCKDRALKSKFHLADSKQIFCFFMSALLHLPSQGDKRSPKNVVKVKQDGTCEMLAPR